MSTTTTTTEVSSNSNSSCRLLVCLNSLPFHDLRVFRSLLGHIELVRLSACCRSLRSSIRNDRALWQERYHRDFLSGAYYSKEMDFVLWCIRTDVNNPCTSDKRADLLENVDWYNTYRRRVSTENNWRYGRCNITHIDLEQDGRELNYNIETETKSVVIIQQSCSDRASGHTYILEYLPHSNLRSSNGIVYSSTFSTSPNILLLGSGNEAKDRYVLGDYYIAVFPKEIESDTNYNIEVLTRKHGGVITTFDVPVQYQIVKVNEKWVLLEHISHMLVDDSLSWKTNIMVFDIDNNTMCPGSINDTWNATRFYKTTNNTAIVYTARLVKDDVDRIEWALHQFSSNNPVIQLRSGWFQVPEGVTAISICFAENSYDSHMLIGLPDRSSYVAYIIHSVASSGQSQAPRNCYTISYQHIPTPLLRAGCDYTISESTSRTIWTDLPYNDDQVLQMPGTIFIRHVIGDIYVFIVRDHNRITSQLLVDISTNEIIRKLEAPNGQWSLPNYGMFGVAYNSDDSHTLVIQEYGEL